MNMHFLIETPPGCNEIVSEAQETLASLIKELPKTEDSRSIAAESNVDRLCREESKFFVLKEGNLKFKVGETLISILEPGDIIGLDYQVQIPNATVLADLAVVVDSYEKSQVFEAIKGDAKKAEQWTNFLNQQISMYFLLSGDVSRGGFEARTEVVNFQAGETMLEQGSEGKEVYHLIEGAADVLVDGVKVGEVKEDEVFGALAALTNSPRSASVVATRGSIAIRVPEDQFLDLIKSKPSTVLALIKDMAMAIRKLNGKIVEMSELK